MSPQRCPSHRAAELGIVARSQPYAFQAAAGMSFGALCAFLASDAAAAMTGNVIHVDAGYHVLG